uniref:Uncharacterized protein n=1 Tax=Anguilla anguilla TaxID=7936 RepID=A0A0E9PSW7_ANGAN
MKQLLLFLYTIFLTQAVLNHYFIRLETSTSHTLLYLCGVNVVLFLKCLQLKHKEEI